MSRRQISLSKVYTFSAAHRLHAPQKDEDFNRRIYDKCNNPNGHGHDYYLEVTVRGAVDEQSGMIIPLPALDSAVHSVIDPLEHRHFDLEIDYFKTRRSTGEEIIQFLWQELEKYLGNKLFKIKLWETNNNYFELERKA
ncbi:6-carboxytetrahydropterin synthase [Calditrichota bacterium GD2]